MVAAFDVSNRKNLFCSTLKPCNIYANSRLLKIPNYFVTFCSTTVDACPDTVIDIISVEAFVLCMCAFARFELDRRLAPF